MDLVTEFTSYCENIKGYSPLTAKEYVYDLRAFFRAVGSAPDVAAVIVVTRQDALRYLSGISQQSANTRARKVATLKAFYAYAAGVYHFENPLADLETPKIKQALPRYLTLSESERLIMSASNKRDCAILMLFLSCGLRISELIGLNKSDLQDAALRITGKGNKERVVYLSDSCMEALRAYLDTRNDDNEAMFISAQKRRISKGTVHHIVKSCLSAAGLDTGKYSAHKLRHTAATLMLQSGVDVRTLQELLGHKHLNTTQIYTHVENDGLRAAARMHPLSSRNGNA